MGIYYVDAADWLRAIGITVVEVEGWKTRARSSGGFPEPGALACQWHHTASSASPENDTAYMFHNADDAPIGNMLLARDGSAWLGAAGAANTAGKGGPLTMSRGTIPLDGANSRTWAIEAANNGVGEPWSQAQVDAYFAISNELNRRFGNLPADIFNHNTWTLDGRKIDPATAAAVQGPWQPRSSSSSGTWNQADVISEAVDRANHQPPPSGDDDMTPHQAEQLDAVYNALMIQNPMSSEKGMSLVNQTTQVHTIMRSFWDGWPNNIVDGPGALARTIKRIASHFNLSTD